MPVRYIHQTLPRDGIPGLCRAAAVGLVTPLRDGMNLVAKEYVAAQDPADPGVLVLSRFAGAAEQLQEALLVNTTCTARPPWCSRPCRCPCRKGASGTSGCCSASPSRTCTGGARPFCLP